jgi:hypothetical protein
LVHNADDGGIDGSVFATIGHASGTALDDQNVFPKTGMHGIHGNDVTLLVVSVGIYKTANQ